jgi:hypothetical protein
MDGRFASLMPLILGPHAAVAALTLSDVLLPEVPSRYLISQKAVDRLYGVEGMKMYSRCSCLGKAVSRLSDSHRASLRIRKLTPLEYERAMGFPEGWTDLAT